MSKAFTREDDVELPPEVPRPVGPVWLTEKGREQLALRVEELRTSGAALAAATLMARLEVARVVPPRQAGDTGPIRLGDRVRVRGEDGERELRLVGPDEVALSTRSEALEAGSADGVELVSFLSPLGAALIGAEVGDFVDVEQPNRENYELEVIGLVG